MPIDAVKIPQNVYIEDRIIGPVTLKQIVIMLIGGGVSYAIWGTIKASSGSANVVQTILAWTPFLIAGAFAFVKINGISLLRFCLLQIERAEKPHTRTWEPRRGIVINIVTSSGEKAKRVLDKKDGIKGESHLRNLSEVLDKGPEEITSGQSALTTPKTDAAEDEPKKPTRAVNPSRVQANKKDTAPSIDGITQKKNTTEPKRETVFRDINPPQ